MFSALSFKETLHPSECCLYFSSWHSPPGLFERLLLDLCTFSLSSETSARFEKGESVSHIDAVQMTAKLKGMVKRCQEKVNHMSCEIPVIRQMLIATGAPAYPVRDGFLDSSPRSSASYG